ncbi:MAG: phosphopeptide-binding protein [Cyclobacteriaceae bacterium]
MKNLALLFLPLFFFACTTSQKEEKKDADDSSTEITLTKAPASPEFPNASLTKTGLTVEPNDSSNSVNYSFEVAEYELGVQTEDAATRGIANSAKGQHIHFIVNNGPYSAHYMPGVSNQLDDGNYVVLAFLSRSYHESVKSPGAFHVENLKVGDVSEEETDLTTPHLFYSRPKGTYKGEDTKKLMLDFYLLNTSISEDGNKVRATINGKEFLIYEWAPFYIEGLPLGEVSIKLELLNTEGNVIEGPFNSVERTVMLEE